MVEEVGVVLRVEGELAIVKTRRSSICDGCHSGGLCRALTGGSDMEVAARNDVGATVGDEVRVTVPSRAFLKASFLAYMVPVMALILGALLGTEVGPSLYPGARSELFSAVFSLILFFLSFVLMRLWTKGSDRAQQYSPVISEIVYGEAHLRQ